GRGERFTETREPLRRIAAPADWASLVTADPEAALEEQERLKAEFTEAFAAGLVGAGFKRDADRPEYLLYPAV
ncbi:MAG TPA: hypothetical protein PKE66_14585, partial [Pyrinomonadaceae bacterium]|nr:hypothetical protein [Pyrinomonadaceae bacterium]